MGFHTSAVCQGMVYGKCHIKIPLIQLPEMKASVPVGGILDVHVGIIAVPKESAQQVCDTLVACGIRAIWNFAPVHLQLPRYVLVYNENLAISLTSLRVQMNRLPAEEEM